MQSSEAFASLDDAIFEIRRLKAEVTRLEQELAVSRRLSASDSTERRSTPEAEALERFARQIEIARRAADHQRSSSTPPRRFQEGAAISEVRRGSEEAAAQHLSELRLAINKLREERAQASVELLKLTRLNSAAAPTKSFKGSPSATARIQTKPPAATGTAPLIERSAIAERTPISPSRDASPRTADDSRPATTLANAGVEARHDLTSAPAPPETSDRNIVWGKDQEAPAPASEPRGPVLVVPADAATLFPSETAPTPIVADAEASVDTMRDRPLFQTSTPPRSRGKLFRRVAALLLIALGVAAAWYFAQPRTTDQESQTSEPLAPAIESQGPEAQTSTATPAPPTLPAEPPAATLEPQDQVATEPQDQAATQPQDQAATQPPIEEPPASPVTPASNTWRIELITSRDVWLRIIVDDVRKMGNTVIGGRTLAFDVDRALSVRAGDAGAVQVVINGDSRGVLGPDGAVVTRIFEVTPRRSP